MTGDKGLYDQEWTEAFSSRRQTQLRQRLAYGTFVCLKRRYLFVETPKNACTKSKNLLWELEHLPARSDGPEGKHKRIRHEGRLSLLDLSLEDANHVITSPDYFKFCFFRDPVSRLVSGYRDKVAWDDLPEMKKHIKRMLARFDFESREEITFSHFAKYICEQPDIDRNHHFASQWRLNFEGRIKFDFVGKVETYQDDMSGILHRLGASESLISTVGQKIHISAGAPVEVEYGIRQMIEFNYADDYKLLDFNV